MCGKVQWDVSIRAEWCDHGKAGGDKSIDTMTAQCRGQEVDAVLRPATSQSATTLRPATSQSAATDASAESLLVWS